MAPGALISVDSFRRLHTPLHQNFVLGWGVQEWEGARTSLHAGSGWTFYAIVALQPERDFAAAALVNAGGDRASRDAIEVVRDLVRENVLQKSYRSDPAERPRPLGQ